VRVMMSPLSLEHVRVVLGAVVVPW